jgi:hypothetical protein
MRSTRTPFGLNWPVADESTESRLNWLLAENEREAMRRRLFRNALEEEQVLLMRHPIGTQKAFALFGTLLGTLPPLAIFYRILYGMTGNHWIYIFSSGLVLLPLVMLAVCCLVGRAMGAVMGRWLAENDGASRTWKFFRSLTAGVAWGAVTGAAGGLPAFGIGAIFGQAYAMAVGMVAFPLFALLHSPLSRGGMIDARHFWPLACGVVMSISALILNL